ncbi:MAG: DUF6165 family protein [Ignavibacteriaceae bacterium]|jgi:hypothetical protein
MKINKILIPVSIGELLDKIPILQIKLEKIKDKQKLGFVKQEHDILKSGFNKLKVDDNKIIINLYKELIEVNRNLWDIEDRIRLKEKGKKFDDEFLELTHSVYFNNDKRSSIKNEINKAMNSHIFEVKKYEKY